LILIDSSIPMYLIGAQHPNKDEARRVLEELIREEKRLVTDAEVLQEILHRYAAIQRLEAVEPAFDALLGVVDEVFPVEREDVERAKGILLTSRKVSARDSLHLAVMARRKITKVFSFDRGFEGFPGVERLPPLPAG
jgi:predicted nucleic acid-binding protein